jgi:hypothetical protein
MTNSKGTIPELSKRVAVLIEKVFSAAEAAQIRGMIRGFHWAPEPLLDERIHLDILEVCDGKDNNCNGQTDESTDFNIVGSHGGTPFHFNDPGDNLGPKSCDLWKPVIAAVNGMACGGAFYMLGEVEFIIAAEHATFFDPHVTYGMVAAFEPIHMSGIMPFGEIMRLSLMGNYERLSALRAHEIGMVSELVPGAELPARAHEVASIIASQPRLAIEGTVRAIWGAREHGQRQAVGLGYAYVALGTSRDSIAEGQQLFESGKRVDWKLR